MQGANEGHSNGALRHRERVTASPSLGILATLPIALTLWLIIIVAAFELIKWVRLS
jgi:hypothetical protein